MKPSWRCSSRILPGLQFCCNLQMHFRWPTKMKRLFGSLILGSIWFLQVFSIFVSTQCLQMLVALMLDKLYKQQHIMTESDKDTLPSTFKMPSSSHAWLFWKGIADILNKESSPSCAYYPQGAQKQGKDSLLTSMKHLHRPTDQPPAGM